MSATDFDRLCEEYDAQVRCVSCHQQVTVRGCKCHLERTYDDDLRSALEWWDSLPPEQQHPKKGVKPAYAVLSAMGAARRRAGLTDEPARRTPQHSVEDLERHSLSDHLGIEPKWRKPRERPRPTPKRNNGRNGTVLPRYINDPL